MCSLGRKPEWLRRVDTTPPARAPRTRSEEPAGSGCSDGNEHNARCDRVVLVIDSHPLGLAPRKETGVGTTVVADSDAAVAQADDLDRVWMTAFAVGSVLVVTSVRSGGCARRDLHHSP
jgi:hypothetical protein